MSRDKNHSIPVGYLKILRWFCNPLFLEDIEGDLSELYSQRAEVSTKGAKIKLLLDIVLLFRPGIIKNVSLNNLLIQQNMLKNHITTAIRHALRFKGYTLINVFGLVIGLLSSILILLWAQDEFKKDKFHKNSATLYMVWRNMVQADGTIHTTPGIPQPLQDVLNNEYPELDKVVLLSWQNEIFIQHGEKSSFEFGRFASGDFFNTFSFPFVAGDPNSALDDLYSIVISEKVATKYFGKDWQHGQGILGEIFKVDDTNEFKITGVFKDITNQSSFEFDWVLPAKEYIGRHDWVESWYNGGFRFFVNLSDQNDLNKVQGRIANEINSHINNTADEPLFLQKFTDSYLYSDFINGQPSSGRIKYVQMLFIMAVFILVIAAINYMNLFTAQASKRAKEIGIRRVIGAPKTSLSMQFFIESFLISIVSILIAICLAFILLPFFNTLTGKNLSINFYDFQFWSGIGIVTLFTGLLSGSYPAIALPSSKVVTALKGGIIKSSGSTLRNGLVVFQLSLSVLLIVGTIVVSQQMDYILTKDLGLDKDNMIYLTLEGDLANKKDAYRTALQTIPEIEKISFANGNPLSAGRSTSGASWEGKNPDDVIEINVLSVDLDFFKTLEVQITQGRTFSDKFGTDTAKFIINQVLADIISKESTINKGLSVWGIKGSIVGVIKNFHMSSMYQPIAPLIIRYDPSDSYVAFIKTNGSLVSAIASIEKITKSFIPAYPFQYDFLEDEYRESYQSEITLSTLANIFAMVSIFISCLGLLGISSFSADQRSKEIGVRKVHGASILTVVLMLSKSYAKLMLLAILISIPIAYYYMQLWLGRFVFRIDLSFQIFMVAGGLAFIVGALTVGYKSYQAAVVNPIKTLKDE